MILPGNRQTVSYLELVLSKKSRSMLQTKDVQHLYSELIQEVKT